MKRSRTDFLMVCSIAAALLQSALGAIVINEVHYNPDVKLETVEFIELYNSGPTAVDISGWQLADGVDYTIPGGTTLAMGDYLVIAQNPSAVLTKFGMSALGPWIGQLNNEGEKVSLLSAGGLAEDQVEYQLGFPWPTVGDAVPDDGFNPGTGHSVQLIHSVLENDLGGNWRSAYPTPGQINTVYALNTPPAIRQVEHTPEQPTSADTVTITAKVTDPDGVAAVTLHVQLVEPGSYIPIRFPNGSSNSDYEDPANWIDLTMVDDGTQGDVYAGDSIYTVVVPPSVQGHRNLVRYRITVEDTLSNSQIVPYADDLQPNFAYFIYDGVPSYTADGVTYSSSELSTIRPIHVLSRGTDISTCHAGGETDYIYPGTIIYDGEVYDHVFYRIKGAYSYNIEGKKKWKFNFHRGHRLKMRDDYGNRYSEKWDKLNLSGGTTPYWGEYGWDHGVDGMILNEAASFKFFNLAGVPSPNTTFLHVRVVDDTSESGTDQYTGDFWGLYIGVEQGDIRFLDEHSLPDGNLYKMAGSAIGVSQGAGEPDIATTADADAFVSGYRSHPDQNWWESNFNLDNYYRYHAVDLAINNSDARPEWNCYYYHNPITDKWQIVPWDLDLTYEYNTHSLPNENLRYSIEDHSALNLEYENRAREIQDLLFNGEQAAQALDELAALVDNPQATNKFHAANRSRWEYDPYEVSRGRDGLFYLSTHFDNFPEVVTYMKDFVSPAGSLGNDFGGGKLTVDIADSSIPDTPTIVYIGSDTNYPENALTFETSAFSDPEGAETFAALKWRVAEVEPFFGVTIPPSGGGTVSLIAADSEWTYFKGTQEPSSPTTAWRELAFNDSSWSTGNAPIGYGPSVNTELTDMRDGYTSVYLRKEFQITDPADIETLILNLNYDEGFNIWINGTHLESVNVPGTELPYTETASSYISGQTSTILSYPNPSFLVPGANIITVQLLNDKIDSSDLLFDPVLTADLVETSGSGGSYDFANTGKPGTYEIDAVWESADITTFTNATRIPAAGIKEGKTYRVRCRMKDSTGRWSHWSSPHQFIAGKPINANIRNDLRVTEVMYNNGDADFIELKNTGITTLNLSAVSITSGVDFNFPAGWTLAAGDFVLVIKDQAAFEAKYGTGLNAKIAGTFLDSNLSNGGETIKIEDFWNGTIIKFEYNDGRGWPIAADGAGHSLIPMELAIEEQPLGTLDYGANWRQSSYIGGSPGAEDPTAPGAGAMINECMAHTDHLVPPHESNDWLELYNAGASTVNLGGNWYLSDDIDDLKQYALPASDLLGGGTITYDQVDHFNPDGIGPLGWGLNKAGDTLFLSYLPGTSADRVVDCIKFKGQENSIALSRYPDGGTYWFHTSPPTRDGANNNPVAHVVISELMYNPQADTATETYDEYVELYNPTDAPIDVWTATSPWALDGGVSYTFPAATTLSASSRILVVDFDPADPIRLAAFEAAYGTGSLTVGTDIFGPWSGDLSNNGERLTLQKSQDSDDPLNPQDISWIIVDECIYNDYWPWPVEVDGTGNSLHRISSAADRSGNDPSNWHAALPAPGNLGIIINPDLDSDGMPNDWETAYSLNPGSAADALIDSDGDGLTNLDEYLSGTNPRNPASVLKLEWISPYSMQFTAVAGKSYVIHYRTALDAGTWQTLTNVSAGASTLPVVVFDPAASTNGACFYLLEIPAP